MAAPRQRDTTVWARSRARLGRLFRRATGRPVRPLRSSAPAVLEEYRLRLASGEGPAAAATGTARELLAADRASDVLVLGYALRRDSRTRSLGDVVLGLGHLHASGPAQAWQRFAGITDLEVVAAASPEYFAAGFATDAAVAAERARLLLTAPAATHPAPEAVLGIAQNAFSVGCTDLAATLLAAAQQGRFGGLTSGQVAACEQLAGWLPGGSHTRPVDVEEATFRFGVLNYQQPDYCSSNVGDFIQTLASLGHLVRRDHLEFVGDPDLVGFVESLRPCVKPERRVPAEPAVVQLVELHRDGSVYQDLPAPTWALAFGWYLHPTFVGGFNLPFHPAVRPLFVSFHLNKPEALTADAIAYLRRYGPVGCRDWQTVALLTAADVPAFFSGCITTTVDTVFARSTPDQRAGTLYVDARACPEGATNLAQAIPAVRRHSLVENLSLARQWVGRYHEEYATVVTRRLHSYLPARSVGCTVDFQPDNPSDPRFGGLIDIEDDAYDAIRQDILALLGSVLDLLGTGAAEEAVYRHWRALCADRVAASARSLAAHRWAEAPLDLPVTGLPTAEYVIVIDAVSPARNVPRLVAALARFAPGVPVVLVGAGAAGGPDGTFCVPGDAGGGSTGGGHDLLMASVLAGLSAAGVERALLLSRYARVTRDLSGLLGEAFGEDAVLARPDLRRNRGDVSSLLRRVSARQAQDWPAALTFLAGAHRLSGHGAQSFDTKGALVSLPRLEQAGWRRWARDLVETYGASWSEALNIVLAGRSRPLPPDVVTSIALETPDPSAAIVNGFRIAQLGWSDVFDDHAG
ncbi:MAG: hypothetical protein QM779_11965 [Propionicimonas sp.]|uniref:hypothetical protein n=1 Tax=Propionicimonas sp. TaxID=1955623 RepID=UPI003D0ABE9F